MAIRVLTINSEYESACRLGFPTKTYLGDYSYKFDDDIVIRWGNSTWTYDRQGRRIVDFKNVVNPAEKIKQNCQKNVSTKLLAQVVNVPTIYEKRVPKGVLAVVRPLEHAAGSGFSVVEGPVEIQRGTYGTRFLKTDAEYRVWFCGNKTMCGRRVKMKINEDQKYPCRSNWGYEFCGGIAMDLHCQTLMAARKLGLDFGAADVLFYKQNWYFLELNTAPSVDHRVVREFFQVNMDILMKEKFPEMFGLPPKKKESTESEPSSNSAETPVPPQPQTETAQVEPKPDDAEKKSDVPTTEPIAVAPVVLEVAPQ